MGQAEAIDLDFGEEPGERDEAVQDSHDRLASFDHVPASEAQRHLAALIRRAHEEQERIVLTHGGKPVAVIVPPEDVELLVDIEDLVDLEMVRERRSDVPIEDMITFDKLVEELGL